MDGCDAFAQNPEGTLKVLNLLASQPIEGVSLEDDRGTYMPFQVGAFVAAARAMLPAPLKLLVHMHTGGGFENASVIEALLQGADGVAFIHDNDPAASVAARVGRVVPKHGRARGRQPSPAGG